jgi:hypothetical protein
MRRLCLAAALVAATVTLTAASPRGAGAQDRAVRFEIAQAGDSTFNFPVATHGWVREGLRGIAVDPKRRDVLVARFLVTAVRDGVATAFITGQTAAVTTDHVVILDEPRRPLFARGIFWGGVALGALVGLIAGSAL